MALPNDIIVHNQGITPTQNNILMKGNNMNIPIFEKEDNTLKKVMIACTIGIIVLVVLITTDNREISSLEYKTVSDWAKNKHQYPNVMKAIRTSVKDDKITVAEYRFILNLIVDINEKEYQEEKSKNMQIIKTQTKD